MAPKNKNKGRGRRSKTPGQTSASDPNPTATSPSASSPTGDATTTSLVPSSASQITTTQPLPSPPLLPVQETHQELISCTSEGSTTTDLAGPSTAPSASSATTRTPTPLPITDEFMSLFSPAAAAGAMTALQRAKVEDPAELHEMVVALLGLQLDEMEPVIGSLLGLAENMKGVAELNVALDAAFNMQVLRSAVEVTEKLLAERKKRHGNGDSCGGSKGEGGGPDSGSGEGDGEGGGVSV